MLHLILYSLRMQRFKICLVNESQDGTPIPRYLTHTHTHTHRFLLTHSWKKNFEDISPWDQCDARAVNEYSFIFFLKLYLHKMLGGGETGPMYVLT